MPFRNPDPDPMALATHFLTRTGHALATGDFARFSACFLLPQRMATPEGSRLIETLDEMRAIFDAVRAHFSDSRATVLDRRCIRAVRLAPDLIEGVHVTVLATGADQPARAPFTVTTQYRRAGPFWRIAGSRYDIGDAPDHAAALLAAGRPV